MTDWVSTSTYHISLEQAGGCLAWWIIFMNLQVLLAQAQWVEWGATCKALVNHLKRVIFIRKPLAKGFWPLVKSFALHVNPLYMAFRITCKPTNHWRVYMKVKVPYKWLKCLHSKTGTVGKLKVGYVTKGYQGVELASGGSVTSRVTHLVQHSETILDHDKLFFLKWHNVLKLSIVQFSEVIYFSFV